MKKIIFVQPSDQVMMGQNDGFWIDDYYTEVYRKMSGYHKPEHFMEIPYWISIISGMVSSLYEKELHVVTDVHKSLTYLQSQDAYVLCSAIDSNLESLLFLIAELPYRQFVIGGHVDPEVFGKFNNVLFLKKVEDITRYFHLSDSSLPDYSFFTGLKNIPRLTMSRGCLYNCPFCMVPKSIETVPDKMVHLQAAAFDELCYELIYLDDKSFSQADNWKYLEKVNNFVRERNQNFLGFIAQTTVNLAHKEGRMRDFSSMSIRYLELGIESLDPVVIKRMRKPFKLCWLKEVMELANCHNVKIVPNFIFGTPGEDLSLVVRWVHEYREQIPAVNVNFLSNIFNASFIRKQGDLPVAKGNRDADQNDFLKSWNSEDDTIEMLQAVRAIFYITSGKDFVPATYAEKLMQKKVESVIESFLDTKK